MGTLRVAVVACMDPRLDPLRALGLGDGEAHVIRNAGGLVTDDVVRSLVVSQRVLGTTAIVVLQHTDCGMEGLDEAAVLDTLEVEPPFALGAFDSVDENLRRTLAELRANPLVAHTDDVRGYVFDVVTGELHEA
jgi:carbonic anhydrase